MKFSFKNSITFAKALDRNDPLKSFRSKFFIPKVNGKTAIYLTGNSLGLQPKSAAKFVEEELHAWAHLGVEGHFHAKRPWLEYHKFSKMALAKLAGAKPAEVVAMNQLTINLHLMMTSFFRPTASRHKIITEAGAFSSDQYAFESQVKLHGFDPDKVIIELAPRKGEFTLRTSDIIDAIKSHGNTVALVIFGGLQYYTGQFFDIKKITQAGHAIGAHVGFDLAHAIGNVPLQLHKHNVDFAIWCGYKYLNSGPGSIAGAFVHERHAINFKMPRLAGWWGHNDKERFQMQKGFKPMAGIDGWQVSNFPVLAGAAQLAALQLFEEAGMKALRSKSTRLTEYLLFLLQDIPSDQFTIITPKKAEARGCQISILMNSNGKLVFDSLIKNQVIADWREPNVIRVAPVPLYNSFEEVFRFVQIFKGSLLNA